MRSSPFWLLAATFLALQAAPCLAAVVPTVVPDSTMGPLRPNECWASLCGKEEAERSVGQALEGIGALQIAEAGITQTNTPAPTAAAKPSASAPAIVATASQPAAEVTDYAAMGKSMLATESIAPTGNPVQAEPADQNTNLAAPSVSTVRPPPIDDSKFTYRRLADFDANGQALNAARRDAKKGAETHAANTANDGDVEKFGTGSRLFRKN